MNIKSRVFFMVSLFLRRNGVFLGLFNIELRPVIVALMQLIRCRVL